MATSLSNFTDETIGAFCPYPYVLPSCKKLYKDVDGTAYFFWQVSFVMGGGITSGLILYQLNRVYRAGNQLQRALYPLFFVCSLSFFVRGIDPYGNGGVLPLLLYCIAGGICNAVLFSMGLVIGIIWTALGQGLQNQSLQISGLLRRLGLLLILFTWGFFLFISSVGGYYPVGLMPWVYTSFTGGTLLVNVLTIVYLNVCGLIFHKKLYGTYLMPCPAKSGASTLAETTQYASPERDSQSAERSNKVKADLWRKRQGIVRDRPRRQTRQSDYYRGSELTQRETEGTLVQSPSSQMSSSPFSSPHYVLDIHSERSTSDNLPRNSSTPPKVSVDDRGSVLTLSDQESGGGSREENRYSLRSGIQPTYEPPVAKYALKAAGSHPKTIAKENTRAQRESIKLRDLCAPFYSAQWWKLSSKILRMLFIADVIAFIAISADIFFIAMAIAHKKQSYNSWHTYNQCVFKFYNATGRSLPSSSASTSILAAPDCRGNFDDQEYGFLQFALLLLLTWAFWKLPGKKQQTLADFEQTVLRDRFQFHADKRSRQQQTAQYPSEEFQGKTRMSEGGRENVLEARSKAKERYSGGRQGKQTVLSLYSSSPVEYLSDDVRTPRSGSSSSGKGVYTHSPDGSPSSSFSSIAYKEDHRDKKDANRQKDEGRVRQAEVDSIQSSQYLQSWERSIANVDIDASPRRQRGSEEEVLSASLNHRLL